MSLPLVASTSDNEIDAELANLPPPALRDLQARFGRRSEKIHPDDREGNATFLRWAIAEEGIETKTFTLSFLLILVMSAPPDRLINGVNMEDFLRQHINEENTSNMKRIEYDVSSIMAICGRMKEILLSEPSLVEFGTPIVIVGDLHGQIRDLLRILDRFSDGKTHGCLCMRFVFLGDYVDRGLHSLEVVMTLFALKILFPNCYGLLRGNHETRSLNRIYGFYQELKERFQDLDTAEEVYLRINDVFDCLPPAALIGGKILCMHGGISPHLKSLDDIRAIPRPIGDITNCPLLADMLWSDPAGNHPTGYFCPNTTRNHSVFYGEDAVENVIQKLGLSCIVRAHQFVACGAAFYADRKVISIFSANSYNADVRNHGACLHVDEKGRITIKSFFTSLFSDTISKDDDLALHDQYLNDDSWMSQAGGEKNNDDTIDPNNQENSA